MQKISVLLSFLLVIGILFSCTRDQAPEITCEGVASYDMNIKAIIDTNCAYEGCHNNGFSAPGIYLSYEGLKTDLDNGKFESRVINIQDMPPSYALGPTMLTQDELDLIICWMEEDYPEN